MSTMKRMKRVTQPGGRRIHRNAQTPDGKKAEIDDTPENRVIMHGRDSQYWAVRIDESDSFGPVTIYDAEGRITRVIERDALRRPWQERQGNTWNNCLFPKRISDKV